MYVLWIVCVDDETYEVLGRLDLPNIKRIKLSDMETPELLKVKQERTLGEYCWTLTPFAPRLVFEAEPTVQRVTYIDADIWFRKHPKPIFDEFDASGKHVLITDHAYAPEYDQSVTSGQYCVQFMTFTRDVGEHVRKWWESRCIEWCFARFEDGKFGDQKYLDDWPIRFKNYVHVLENKEIIQAPWNSKIKNYKDACLYHFHGFKIIKVKKFILHGAYDIPYSVINSIYNPYVNDINASIVKLKGIGFNFKRSLLKEFSLQIYKIYISCKLYVKKIF